MKKTSETIVFFGSGPVAASSLDFLAEYFAVEAVITKPQPAHHQERFPVLDTIQKWNLAAHYPTNKDELSELFHTSRFQSRLGIVVDYGFIINKDVIDRFPLGIVNSHFSLLPEWRGADPITFAILSGQAKTGVSLMLIEPSLDTGKLLAQKSLTIASHDTTPSLTNRLVDLSNQVLLEYLPRYLSGELKPRSQPHSDRVSFSRKISKSDGIIDWTKPAEQIEREIRAYVGWPGSQTTLAGKDVIITQAHTEKSPKPKQKVGKVTVSGGKDIKVQTGKDLLVIDQLKPAGRREMPAQAFLAGYGQLIKN